MAIKQKNNNSINNKNVADKKNHSYIVDVLFLLSILLTLFTAMSIYSYSPEDPSSSVLTFSKNPQDIHNLFGKSGAFFSDMLGVLFGTSTLIIPIFTALLSLEIYNIRKNRKQYSLYSLLINTFLIILLTVSISSLIGITFSADPFFANKPSGGIIGLFSNSYIISLLGKTGAVIGFSFIILILAILIFKFSLPDISLPSINYSTLFGSDKEEEKEQVKQEIVIVKEDNFAAMNSIDNGAEKTNSTAIIVTQPEEQLQHKSITHEPEKKLPENNLFEENDNADSKTIFRKLPNTPSHLNLDNEQEDIVKDYIIPVELLDPSAEDGEIDSEQELKLKGKILEQKLLDFGVDGKVKEIQPGPVVTLFEYEPAPGIKISKIANLENDLALTMSAISVRIIAPIPGKAVVGVELPNKKRLTVSLKELIISQEFANSKNSLSIILGKDISGKPYITDLAKMPHLLIAGTTGSGKSVSVNTIICSLIYKCPPDLVKFAMIDPKMVELSIYEGIPHLAAPVVTDPRKAANLLKNVVIEMENRYTRLAELKVRNIESYNAAAEKNDALDKLPYLVVIVDEFADLMIVAGKEVEQSIIRIAQMARAVGIHLILATQRPSVNVITGIIKANMPARLSFRVSSKTDSRTILDQNGAEMLLGKGDSLFIPPGSSEPVRIHGCFVSENEVNRIVEYLKQIGEPEYNSELIVEDNSTSDSEIEEDELDEKYLEAVSLVKNKGFASISMVQRYLKIGYNRAARIVEIMEKQGIVAPSDGTSKPREVYIKD